MLIKCSWCEKEFNKKPSRIAENNYCCKECSTKSRFTGVNIKCNTCGKDIYVRKSDILKSKSGYNYCSRSCATAANNSLYRSNSNHPLWKGGLNTYRFVAFSNYPPVCNRCGYDEEVGILQVHHIDRDRSNISVDNLEILCPNCHMLEHFLNDDGLYTTRT